MSTLIVPINAMFGMSLENINATATLAAALVAAIASLSVAYYSMRTQSKIEVQKADILKNIEFLKDQLDQEKNFVSFKRDRIYKHLEEVYLSFSDIYSIAITVALRQWLASHTDLETEVKFRKTFSELKLSFHSLYGLKVIPEESFKEFKYLELEISDYWERVMGEAALRTKEFIDEFPDHRKFNPHDFHEIWLKLIGPVEKMEKIILKMNSDILEYL